MEFTLCRKNGKIKGRPLQLLYEMSNVHPQLGEVHSVGGFTLSRNKHILCLRIILKAIEQVKITLYVEQKKRSEDNT